MLYTILTWEQFVREIPSLQRQNSFSAYLKSYTGLLRELFGAEALKLWAIKAGITSRITFKHFVNDRRPPNEVTLQLLHDQMDMGYQERNGTSGNPALAEYYASDDFLSDPLNTILLNVCALPKNRNLAGIIAGLAHFYDEATVIEGLNNLSKLNLIRTNSEGCFERIFMGTVTSIPGVRSTASQQYFERSHVLAAKSWPLPLHEREFNAFSICLNKSDMPKVKDLIRNLRKDIGDLSARQDCDTVYQFAISALPITKS